ncbi:LytTR family DNA-binding domain-containing protein [uncultured Pseudoflavonifractor sp.]|uniref:LytR/AlgR family response regulator transcription factor n=1 Tax=uncultured Pseudoflavonifractor sp. TaxID=1221379 RepID=UPI0025FB6CB7|nr:response regulator [uncultured Pseudoflavonifractor sp.]
MIRIAIVEDEQEQINIMQEFLTRYEQEKNVDFEVAVFDSGVKFLADYQPIYDLVFMDIQMPHLNGLDTARTIFSMDKNIGIVFVTNMMQYAIKGYEVDALDFIVKPLKYYQFSVKLARVIEKVRKREGREIVLTVSKEKIRLSVSEILLCDGGQAHPGLPHQPGDL